DKAVVPTVSIPFSSGHFLQQVNVVACTDRFYKFQSPSHRGTFSNTAFTSPPAINGSVSIPFSSGHFLQPSDVVSVVHGSWGFQSSSPRGTSPTCQPTNYLRRDHSNRFNPLLIGALSPPHVPPNVEGAVLLFVSIPFSSGHFLQ